MHSHAGLILFFALLAIAFVAIAALVFVLVRLVRHGASAGASPSSGLGGCSLAAAAGCLGLIGLGALGVLVLGWLVIGVRHRVAITHSNTPGFGTIRIETDDGSDSKELPAPAALPAGGAHFVFLLRGAHADTSEVERWVREASGVDPRVDLRTIQGDGAQAVETRVELTVPIDESRVDEVESALRKRLQASESSRNGSIVFEGVERDA